MKLKAEIDKEGKISFGGTINTARANEILKEHVGDGLIITLDDRESVRMRRFFEGAVVPYYFYQHPKSGWKSFRDPRELLKLHLIPTTILDERGNKVVIPRSTMMSRRQFRGFLDMCEHFFEENGLEYPDSEEYREWEKMAPLKGEIYPPLKRIFDAYKLAISKA